MSPRVRGRPHWAVAGAVGMFEMECFVYSYRSVGTRRRGCAFEVSGQLGQRRHVAPGLEGPPTNSIRHESKQISPTTIVKPTHRLSAAFAGELGKEFHLGEGVPLVRTKQSYFLNIPPWRRPLVFEGGVCDSGRFRGVDAVRLSDRLVI